jgi:hypothetical protein
MAKVKVNTKDQLKNDVNENVNKSDNELIDITEKVNKPIIEDTLETLEVKQEVKIKENKDKPKLTNTQLRQWSSQAIKDYYNS